MDVIISSIFMKNIENYRQYLIKQIEEIIEDSTYSELSNYISLLPKSYEGKESLFYWGMSYINEYYKAISILEQTNGEEIDKLKEEIYYLYLSEMYSDIKLNYKEFITFSKLLNITFPEYNPKLERTTDKHPFDKGTKEENKLVNEIIKSVMHAPHPEAYEIIKFNLDTLIECLQRKRQTLLESKIYNIDLDDYALNSVLSKKRIQELKQKYPQD